MSLNRYTFYWANNLSNDPTTGRPNREAPPPEVKLSGLRHYQPEAYEWYNYQHWITSQGLFQIEDEYTAADNQLQSNIDQEQSDRENSDSDLQQQIDDLVTSLNELQNKVIPKVGDTWITKSTEDPVTRFGVGTWSLIEGKMLIGIDSGDTDFDTIGEEGGSKTHSHGDTFSVNSTTLTESQIPSHTHTVNYIDAYYPEEAGKIAAAIEKETMPVGHNSNLGSNATDTDNDTFLTIDRTTESESTGEGNSHTHGLSGGVSSSSNMTPYHVVYIWERTA